MISPQIWFQYEEGHLPAPEAAADYIFKEFKGYNHIIYI